MATSDQNPAARKKATYALSSAVRNYQPAMDEVLRHLPDEQGNKKVDASDMDAVDSVINKLKAQASV